MKSIRIPKQWKITRVSAIHKKGNRKLASNYRPVSITDILQIFETLFPYKIRATYGYMCYTFPYPPLAESSI